MAAMAKGRIVALSAVVESDESEDDSEPVLEGRESVGPVSPLSELMGQFVNDRLLAQFHELGLTFGAWRHVRGDGNCYWRGAIFQYLDGAIRAPWSSNLSHLSGKLAELEAEDPAHLRTGLNYSFGTKKYCHQIRKFHGIFIFFCNFSAIVNEF